MRVMCRYVSDVPCARASLVLLQENGAKPVVGRRGGCGGVLARQQARGSGGGALSSTHAAGQKCDTACPGKWNFESILIPD